MCQDTPLDKCMHVNGRYTVSNRRVCEHSQNSLIWMFRLLRQLTWLGRRGLLPGSVHPLCIFSSYLPFRQRESLCHSCKRELPARIRSDLTFEVLLRARHSARATWAQSPNPKLFGFFNSQFPLHSGSVERSLCVWKPHCAGIGSGKKKNNSNPVCLNGGCVWHVPVCFRTLPSLLRVVFAPLSLRYFRPDEPEDPSDSSRGIAGRGTRNWGSALSGR